MSSIEVPGSPYLSLLTSRLYDQLCAFGVFATDVARVDSGYQQHAATIVAWTQFLQAQQPPSWSHAEPFVLPPAADHTTPPAGYAKSTSVTVAHLAEVRLAAWTMRFKPVGSTTALEQRRLSRGAVFIARAQGVEAAFAWLVEIVSAGWVAQWSDVALCLSLLSLLDADALERLPAPSDLHGWERPEVLENLGHHLDMSLSMPLITHNGATPVPFGVAEQRRLVDLGGRVLESARQSANLDQWALGCMLAQTMLSAVLRQFPADRSALKLSVRHALNQFDEVVADVNPLSTAGTGTPHFRNTWEFARGVVGALIPTLGAEAASHIVDHRLLLPRVIADKVLAEDELPMGWQFIGPAVALPWGAVRGWNPRRASPDDYVPPLGSTLRSIELEAAKDRADLNDAAVPLLAGLMLNMLAAGELDIDFPLGMAISDHPYSDEILSVAAYQANRRGQGDQACALGIGAVLAQPRERERWHDLSRHLKAAGRLEESFLVYVFQEMHQW